MKTLVVFYSLEGNTAEAAAKIAQKLGADVAELKTVKPMTMGAARFLLGGGQALTGKCPKIQPFAPLPQDYERIVLGTPVWAGRCAPAINTFLQDKANAEKVSAVFAYSGSGNSKSCVKNLKKRLPNLRFTCSLADRRTELAAQNEGKLNQFIENLLSD